MGPVMLIMWDAPLQNPADFPHSAWMQLNQFKTETVCAKAQTQVS